MNIDWELEDEEDEPKYENEYDLTEDIVNSDYVADIIALTKQHIEAFFKDRQLHCGGSIPQHILNSLKRISKVMNTDIGDCIDLAYVALEKTIDPDELEDAEKFGTVTDDIKLVRSCLDVIAQAGVPKCFAGGILLMYLEFCEGVDF